ncbi:hypothetical protein BBI15_13640 [Planococcus plakortidis]|uniref:Uncharacterized protein n=2 Tax=Planococcus TaxID=1372 RepID=A0A1C7EAX2_9BACL|nr:hypothetical protein [Planococcus plakortidis]ANU21153.1 hypothetical protein BBI15_13640 [Planococcus plakortidis]RAZ67814.1 hypothetical protein DP119_09215 [Planococcus maitriensis]
MNKFSYKSRLLYFGLLGFFSLGFFLLQLYSVMNSDSGIGSYVLLVLWALMIAFGVGGLFFTMKTNKERRGK